MPELPEVEVTRLGIVPYMEGRRIVQVTVRNPSLRWPVPVAALQALAGARVGAIRRRGKFLLIPCDGLVASRQPSPQPAPRGHILVHLGMTGTLRALQRPVPVVGAHDHVDIELNDGLIRYNDPRRFGAVLWHDDSLGPVEQHALLAGLGVEPFSPEFAGNDGAQLLFDGTRQRNQAIKQVLLGGQLVVGVGNIYASESLFRARINPKIAAGRIALVRYARLAEAIRSILAAAIAKGGSTLRDFVGSDGQAGYFQQEYFVYDRAGEACRVCTTAIAVIRQGQRSTFYCPRCQRN